MIAPVARSDGRRAPSSVRHGRTAGWRNRRTAVGLGFAGLTLSVMDVALTARNGWPVTDEYVAGWGLAAVFLGLGALLAWKRPGNNLGWLLLGMATLSAGGSAAYQYGIAVTRWAEWLPAPDLIGGTGWAVQSGAPFGIMITFFLLLYPDGRLPSRRWRPAAWAAAIGITGLVTGLAISAVAVGPDTIAALTQRGADFEPSGIGRTISEAGNVFNLAVFPLAVASLFVRRGRAGPVERRQLQWFAYGAVLFVLSILPQFIWTFPFWVEYSAALFLAVAIAVAITRYRLYEIDRIISRTVAYALVTAVLIAVYALVAVVPSLLLDVESEVLVAAATLAAAALFVPLRRRVQTAVDRRFNRARYDAAQVVERFGSRLRGDLDLAGLTGDVQAVVRSTMQPVHASVWLRPEGVDR